MKITRKTEEEDKQINESNLPYTKKTSLYDIDRYIYDAESIDVFSINAAIISQLPLMFSGRVMRPPVFSSYLTALLTLFLVFL